MGHQDHLRTFVFTIYRLSRIIVCFSFFEGSIMISPYYTLFINSTSGTRQIKLQINYYELYHGIIMFILYCLDL